MSHYRQSPSPSAHSIRVLKDSWLSDRWWFVVFLPLCIGCIWVVTRFLKADFAVGHGMLFLFLFCLGSVFVFSWLKKKCRSFETVVLDGDRLYVGGHGIDFSQPFGYQVQLDGNSKTLWIDLSQAGRSLGFRSMSVDPDSVTNAFWAVTMGPTKHPNEPRFLCSGVGSEWHWTEALLRQIGRRRTQAQPWTKLSAPEPGVFRALFAGFAFLFVVMLVSTAAASVEWIPKWAAFYCGLMSVGFLWPTLKKHAGCVASLTAWLSLAGLTVGALFASDYLVWQFAPAIDAKDLNRFATPGLQSRPKRVRGLKVRTEWGTPWTKESYGSTTWYTTAVAVTGAGAKRSDRVKLWLLCEKTYNEYDFISKYTKGTRSTRLAKAKKDMDARFLLDTKKDCYKQWKGRVIVPVDSDTLRRHRFFIGKGAEQKKLKLDSIVRLAFAAPSVAGRQKPLESILIKSSVILLFGWFFGVLWVRRKRLA